MMPEAKNARPTQAELCDIAAGPAWANFKTEAADPDWEKDRGDGELPRKTLPKASKVGPILPKPQTDATISRQPKLLRVGKRPTCEKASTKAATSVLATLLDSEGRSSRATSTAGSGETKPRQDRPGTDAVGSHRSAL